LRAIALDWLARAVLVTDSKNGDCSLFTGFILLDSVACITYLLTVTESHKNAYEYILVT